MLTEMSPANAYLLASATMQFRNAEDARNFAALDHTMAFVAGEAETVTGYCWGYYLQRPDSSAMACVHELEVAERHWRRGIGRGLMLAIADQGDTTNYWWNLERSPQGVTRH